MELAHKLLSTRRGTVLVGVFAGVLAASVLLVYLNRYRNSLNESATPVTVLVAKSLIQKGTPGDVIGSQDLFQATRVPKSQLTEGAIADAAGLRGRVAVDDIYPGQQLTTADFSATATDAISYKLTGDQRAISVPLDSAHGLIGQVQTGDHVDVFAGFNVDRGSSGAGTKPVLKIIMENALVLHASDRSGGFAGSSTSNVVLRATYQQAAEMAFAADNGKLWIVLRPPTGARPVKPGVVTVETLLFGVKPVTALRNLKKTSGGSQ